MYVMGEFEIQWKKYRVVLFVVLGCEVLPKHMLVPSESEVK